MLRSVAVIGAIFALSPVREDPVRRDSAPAPRPEAPAALLPTIAGESPAALLREPARVWGALPEEARRQLAEEVARLLAEGAADAPAREPRR